MILIILMILAGLFFHFEPSIKQDKNETRFYYNSDRHLKQRKYKKLW
jgi:hypothetical protein